MFFSAAQVLLRMMIVLLVLYLLNSNIKEDEKEELNDLILTDALKLNICRRIGDLDK